MYSTLAFFLPTVTNYQEEDNSKILNSKPQKNKSKPQFNIENSGDECHQI